MRVSPLPSPGRSARLTCLCFQVECYDYDSDGSHDLIGAFQTTMTQLKGASRSSPVSCVSCPVPPLAQHTDQGSLGCRVLGDRGLVIGDPESRLAV